MPEEEMAVILANELATVASQTTLTLQGLVHSMKASGMSDKAIKASLMADLNSGGRLFGSFRNQVKNTVRSGIDMAGNISSEQRFVKGGVKEFQWVTVQTGVCPDCIIRHGNTGTMEYWRTVGRPKSGFSVCGSNCRCRLIPVKYKRENLDKPLVREKKININAPRMAGKHKSVKDSISWMKSNGAVSVNLKKISLDFANTITLAISKMPSKLKKDIIIGDFAHFQQGQGMKFKVKSGHNYGVSNVIPKDITKIKELKPSWAEMKKGLLGNFNVIGFNTKRYKSLSEITKKKIANNAAWIKSKGRPFHFNTTGEAMIHHEFGHLVQESLTIIQREKWNTIAKKWIKADNTEYLKKTQAFTDFHSEAFAEAWGAYQTGQASRLPTYIIEFIESITI